MTELELSRRYCRDSGDAHVWQIRYGIDGHESVYCTRCMRSLSVGALLDVYIERYGGTRLP